MSDLKAALRRVLRRDVLAICLVIFCADIMSGIVSPSFSLYARQLGASLTFIGVLSSTVGVTRLVVSMPFGLLSDRVGRKTVVTLGMVSFAVALALFAIAPNAYFLLIGRVIDGIAMVCTFLIGAAYVSDIVAPEERALAFGLYSTAMGLGFTVGPLVGAAVAVRYGIAGSYWAGAIVGLTGAVIAASCLKDIRSDEATVNHQRRSPWADLQQMMHNRNLMAGSLANLLMNMVFSGAVVNFFPVYAAQLGIPQAMINSMFSARALTSASARLPTGAIASKISSRIVMLTALMIAVVAMFLLPHTQQRILLSLLLILEGIAFGSFLTSGQIFVAQHSAADTRGAAVGAYSAAGSLSSIFSPILLGVVADLGGVQTVFWLTGLLVLLGIAAIEYLYKGKNPVYPLLKQIGKLAKRSGF
ncbi:MAG: MFS transporter [Anaerolineae bacterium]